jgi:DNA-directed RNA polymerase II subunit RPB1
MEKDFLKKIDGTIEAIQFFIPTTVEILKTLSVVEITNPMTTVEFDKNNTMFDTRMGAFRNVKCATCKGSFKQCSGHHGRINLFRPCVNSRFANTLLKKILSLYCFGCYKKLSLNEGDKEGDYEICDCVLEVDNKAKTKKLKKKNPTGIRMIRVTKKMEGFKFLQGLRYAFSWTNKFEQDENGADVPVYLNLEELYQEIKKIPKETYLRDFNGYERYEDLTEPAFIKHLLVLPTTSRPPNMSNGEWRPDGITRLYIEVLKQNLTLSMSHNSVPPHLFVDYHYKLQNSIDILFDTTQTNNKLRLNVVQGGGLRQRIDGKKGRLRLNLMGKRVEYSARTVLEGDPKLGINEVGIPRRVAEDLTIPMLVNRYNIHKIMDYKIKYVNKKDGRRYDTSIFKNYRLEIGDTVERCLIDGDIVAVNRQPTLHRGSIIGCYIRIFNDLTFRLNYSTMITLNADSDGDEINMHVPQDLESRAEIENLMMASTNIVSSQSSKPLIGCTQDSLLGCYHLSKVEKLPMDDYMDILCKVGLDDEIFDKRHVIKHVKGTRFITAVLNSLDIYISRYEPSEDFLLIDNVIQYGILNKAIVGTADNSIIHHIYLRVGHLKAAKFIHMIQIAATAYLDIRGFSVGISDCVVEHEKIHFDKLEYKLVSEQIAGKKWTTADEVELSGALSELTRLNPPPGIVDNRLLDMINSGSKGSIVNFNQITRVVGQQVEDTGRIAERFGRMGNGRTLPHFTINDPRPGSRGLVKNSFIKGLSPSEFFMHAMGGRIGLIDTACKTSVTGAQYRRLVKILEPLIAKDVGNGKRTIFNQTTDQLVQFEYGENSYDATWLKRYRPDSTNRYAKRLKTSKN